MAVSPGDEKLDVPSLVLFLSPRYHRLLVQQIQAPTAYSALILKCSTIQTVQSSIYILVQQTYGQARFPLGFTA